MKQSKLKPCAVCGKGVMHNRNIVFFRVKIERMIANVPAIQRQHGLEMMMGGSAMLANIMGPDEDMAKPLAEAEELLVCDDCAMFHCLAAIQEMAQQKSEELTNVT